ncbi:MAG: mechanosensitive ion channel [Planctomycetaceae bacterium]
MQRRQTVFATIERQPSDLECSVGKSPSVGLIVLQMVLFAAVWFLATAGTHAEEISAGKRAAQLKAAIVARQQKFEKDADLDAEAKKEALSILETATKELAAGNEAAEQSQGLARQLETVTKDLELLNRKLAGLPAKSSPPAVFERDVEKLSRRHDELEAKLNQDGTGLMARLEKLAAEIRDRPDRLEKVVGELAKYSARLEEVQAELKTAKSAERTTPAEIAQLLLLHAQELRCQQELAAANIERDWLESSDVDHWLQAQQHLFEHEAAGVEAELKIVAELIDEVRRREAADRVADAKQESLRVHPALQPLALENEALAEESRRLAESLEETGSDQEDAEELLESLKDETDNIQSMIEKVDITDAIGLMLRQQRSQLPDIWRLRRNMAARAEELRDLRLRLFELQRIEKQTPDVDELVQLVRRQTQPDAPLDESLVEQQAKTLLDHREELLEQLQDDNNKLIKALVALDEIKQKTLQQVKEFNALHDENVLWIRSAKIVGWHDIRELSRWDASLFHAAAWETIAESLFNDLERRSLLYWLAGGAALAYVLLRVRTRRELNQLADDAAQPDCETMLPTLVAAALTLCRAAAVPAAVAFLAWRLDESTTQATLGRALAGGLWRLAGFSYPLLVIRSACGRQGLGPAHFGWTQDFARSVKRQVGWFLPWSGAWLFIIGGVESLGNETLSESLGRLAFFVFMVSCGLFAIAVLKLDEEGSHSAAFGNRGWRAICWFGRVIPWALLLLAAAGYYYTALQLVWRIQETVWASVAILGLRAFFLRWIELAERRIIRSPNLAASSETTLARKRKSLFGWNRWNLTDRGIDVTTMIQQMQGLLRAALLVGVTVSAWTIWADVTPALGLLNRVTLWHTPVTQQEIVESESGAPIAHSATRLKPVTAADLGLAILVFMVSLASIRNIPGLVQALLLERLPLDVGARFAVTIIVRYVLLVVGIVISCAQINIGWANVQWLVAAASVGLGFGLQEIFANFVSGIILLLERPIRVGDVITIGDTTGNVSQIRVRSTTIVDGDRRELVVPNKDFITGKLLNWTLTDRTNRIVIRVGVSYNCDAERVRRLLQEVAQNHPAVLKDPAPTVTLEEFGATALIFVVRAFLPTLDDRRKSIHEMHATIFARFQAEGIEMPAPSAPKKPAPLVGTAA